NDPGELLGAGTASGECPSGAGGMGATTAASTTAGVGGAMSTVASSSATTGAGGAGGGLTGTVLDLRKKSYTEALRTASFKLVGNAPTLQQIEDLKSAPDQAKAYAEQIDAMMS